MINIKSYATDKLSGQVTSIASNNGFTKAVQSVVNGVYLWGQFHDHSKDIEGDMTNVGNIAMNGNIIGAKNINANNINTTYLTAVDGAVNDLHSDTITADTSVTTYTLNSTNINNSDSISTKNLTVTGSAYFFQLVIDKIEAVGGAVLLTPADGFVVDRVEPVSGQNDRLRLLWKATDGSKKIANMWQVNDQAICQTFNAATGVNYNVSNKYYWTLVVGVGTTTLGEQDYHYIDISTTTYDGVVNPEVGDEIAMLGYRGTDDASRQSAIYIAAYNSIDTGITAPLIAQYTGINDFNLANHRQNVISNGYVKFKGTFETLAGDDLGNQVSTLTQDMNSISATVQTLTYDDKNLYGVSSFAGAELEENNRWEFRSDANYSFDLWDDYRCVFEEGKNDGRWIMKGVGTSTIYAPYIEMTAGQTYTLNCDFIVYDTANAIKLYQYSNRTNAQILNAAQEWYLNANGQLVTTRPGRQDYEISNVIQFTVPSNGYYRLGFQNIVTSYDASDDNYCDLDYVRLYEGAYDADEFENWNNQLSESYSRMYMDSGKITLSVNDVSLQLDGLRNNIILNGNTIINGTLNLNDTTQGLVLTGDNGQTKFSPESIGTWQDWSGQLIVRRNVVQYDDVTPTVSTGNTYQSISTFEYIYGNQKAGEEITINNLLITVSGNTASNISTTLYVYQNNSQVGTPFTFTGTTIPATPYESKYVWAMTANAQLKFKFVITVTYSSNTPASIDLTYRIQAPITAMLQIGYDGLGMLYDSGSSAVYFGEEGTIVTYGDYGLKVNDTGIYKWVAGYGWAKDRKDLNVNTISSNYTLNYDDDFIIGNGSSSITLTLPTEISMSEALPAGKIVYVKNRTSNTFTVSCPNKIIEQDSRTPTSSFTAGNRMYFLIWDGTYWNVGYAG